MVETVRVVVKRGVETAGGCGGWMWRVDVAGVDVAGVELSCAVLSVPF